MMKKLLSLLSLLLAAAMLLPLASCGKKEETAETAADPGVLTCVFRGKSVELPEDYRISYGVMPFFNEETGGLTVPCMTYEDKFDDEGNFVDSTVRTFLLTFGADGKQTGETELTFIGNRDIARGAFVGDDLVFCTEEYEENSPGVSACTLHRANLKTGEITADSDNLIPLFSGSGDRPWFYIDNMCVDSDGWVYLCAEQEILVLNENFIKQFSVTADNWINSIAASPDGKVYITSYTDGGVGVFPIDKEKKALGKAAAVLGNQNSMNLFFGKDHDLYYSTDVGVFALDYAKDGETEDTVTPILNYINSDLSETNLTIYAVLDSETILMGERSPDTYQTLPGIYRKAEDIDLSEVVTIELAYGSNVNYYRLPEKIVAFNKAHDDVKVVTVDYSRYSTDEDYFAGEEKLTTDILNGLYQPDIVIGGNGGTAAQQMAQNGLFVDLAPLLKNDPDLSWDDLFGSVKRTLSDKEGRLWGITNAISATTLAGRTDVLGGRTEWTFSEMLDFAESLPDGVQLFENLNQENAPYLLMGQDGYGAFLDLNGKTCSFDSADFVRYLKFLASLPQAPSAANFAEAEADRDTRYLRYHNGQIVLEQASLHMDVAMWLRVYGDFGTTAVTRIGYPREHGQPGSRLQLDDIYVISSACEHPEEAWSFLRTILLPAEDNRGMMDIPAFRSQFRTMAEEAYRDEFEVYFDGSMSWGTGDPNHPKTQEDLTEPGLLLHFTEADTEAMIDFFDNQAGIPLSEAVPDEISAIIAEEIEACLGGARSAEECAKLIQSRVSLWMSEHE